MGYSSSAGLHLVVEEGAGDSVTHIHLLGDALVERGHTLEIGVLAVLAWVDRSHWSIGRQAQLGDQALHDQTFASSPAIDLRRTQGASQALELIADQLRLATSGVAWGILTPNKTSVDVTRNTFAPNKRFMCKMSLPGSRA